MDTTRWKSVAVRAEDYFLLKGLCEEKFRAPGSMISKLVHNYLEFQSQKKNLDVNQYKKKLMNGHANDNNKDFDSTKNELLHKKKYELKF